MKNLTICAEYRTFGKGRKYHIFQTEEFAKWFRKQSPKVQLIITARFERIIEEDHWGLVNRFDGLVELKWISGMRIYTTLIGKVHVIILLGGNKNGQSKDIKKAKRIIQKVSKSL